MVGAVAALMLAGVLLSTGQATASQPPAPPTLGTMAATKAPLYPDCLDISVPYSLTLPPGATYFTLWVTARGPDGSTIAADAVSSVLGDSTTGVAVFTVCGRTWRPLPPWTQIAHPGRYVVTATGNYDGLEIPRTDFQLAPSTLVFRAMKTKTRAHVSGKTVTVRVKDYRLDGFTSTDKARVYLERRDGRRWVRIPRSNAATDANGRAIIRVKVTAPTKVRAVNLARHNWRRSVSIPVTVRP